MIIGCPKETKSRELRVGLTPAGVRELVRDGHTVHVETQAGAGSGFADADYEQAGAQIVQPAARAWEADLVIKVKEPLPEEFDLMAGTKALFTYLHLAAAPECARALQKHNVTAVAYETIRDQSGQLPLLAPMSEVAGRLSVQVGAHYLLSPQGGAGKLLGGVPGTLPGNVVIIGAGVAGENAAKIALGMGAAVTVIDINIARLRQLSAVYGQGLKTLASNELNIAGAVAEADLVVGSVLIPGAAAPKLVTTDMIHSMREGSVLVDIAIDQGGCFEGATPTTHEDPLVRTDGKLMYCVANMPGAVPQTATAALTNATLPYVRQLAGMSGEHLADKLRAHTMFQGGLNVHAGEIVHPEVTQALKA